LSNLQRMRKAVMKDLSVFGRCYLGDFGKAPKCGRIQDAVTITLSRAAEVFFGNFWRGVEAEIPSVLYIRVVDHPSRNKGTATESGPVRPRGA